MSSTSSLEWKARDGKPVPRDVSRKLWAELHEQLKRRFEQTLFAYTENLISKNFPSYCSSDGRLIDRRLAKRIGVDPALICRLRAEDSGALNRLAHFLAMMNLCGVSWDEVGFPSPQEAVLDAIVKLFPIAEGLLGLGPTNDAASAVPNASPRENLLKPTPSENVSCAGAGSPFPSREEVLLLYFVANSPTWKPAFENRHLDRESFEVQCEKIFILVACADSDGGESNAPLVPRQTISSSEALVDLLDRYSQVWDALYETFPFLGLPLDRKGIGGWGIF